MKNSKAGRAWAGAFLGAAAVVGVSCTIDTSKIVFDDNPNGSGGSSSAVGGSGNLGGDGSNPASGGSGSNACKIGEMLCDGQQVQICTGETRLNVGGKCPFACVDGACTGTCVPDEKQCVSATELETCDATGTWLEPTVCNKKACVEGACVGVCAPGDYRCGGTNDGMPQLCDQTGSWVDQRETNCAGDDCTNGICTGACDDGEKQCTGALTRQLCIDAAWENQPACPFVCVGGDCAGECVSGSSQCVSTTGRQICSNGFWGATSTCQFACVGSECGGVCKPKSLQCNGKWIQECSDVGAWANDKNCNDPSNPEQTCRQVGEKFVCGVCDPGTLRCNGNSVDICDEKGLGWSEKGLCKTAGTVCLDEGKGPDCVELDSRMCASHPSLRTCISANKGASCEGGKLESFSCPSPLLCHQSTGTCGPR